MAAVRKLESLKQWRDSECKNVSRCMAEFRNTVHGTIWEALFGIKKRYIETDQKEEIVWWLKREMESWDKLWTTKIDEIVDSFWGIAEKVEKDLEEIIVLASSECKPEEQIENKSHVPVQVPQICSPFIRSVESATLEKERVKEKPASKEKLVKKKQTQISDGVFNNPSSGEFPLSGLKGGKSQDVEMALTTTNIKDKPNEKISVKQSSLPIKRKNFKIAPVRKSRWQSLNMKRRRNGDRRFYTENTSEKPATMAAKSKVASK